MESIESSGRRQRQRPSDRHHDYSDRRSRREDRRRYSRSPSRRRRRRSRSSDDDDRRDRKRRRRSRSPPRHRRRYDEYREDRSRRRRRRRPRSPEYSSSPRPLPAEAPPRAGVVSDDDDTARRAAKAPPPRSPSTHDDTIGHFRGGSGAIIADRYRINREVGVGTFGRVLECLDLKTTGRYRETEQYVAIKVVRNVKRYYESALIEANIVEDVNRRGGRGMTHCVVMHDAFSFNGHYCMVFERLGPSLFDFLKRHKYKPFPMVCVQDFAIQLLETLEFLHSFRLIHTDLKIENVLLMNSREVTFGNQRVPESTRIKVIDFGGACFDDDKKSSIINTRQYRAPEVILGTGWSMPSDMWSAGCILAELYRGELLFATHDNLEHLALMERIVGLFPRRILKKAKTTSDIANQAFDSNGRHRLDRVLSPDSASFVKKANTLESTVRNPDDAWFLTLLRKILVIDPNERATAHECMQYLSRIRKDVARYN